MLEGVEVSESVMRVPGSVVIVRLEPVGEPTADEVLLVDIGSDGELVWDSVSVSVWAAAVLGIPSGSAASESRVPA